MANKISADEKRWRAEDDLRTLQRAEEIKADRSRLVGAQKHAKAQVAALSKVAGSKPAARKR